MYNPCFKSCQYNGNSTFYIKVYNILEVARVNDDVYMYI